MASQYQHRQLFRRVPNALLARYFEDHDTDLGVDFTKLKETENEPIFKAFTALPEEQQAAMEVDFQNINTLASDGGIDALHNEAEFYEDETFPDEISAFFFPVGDNIQQIVADWVIFLREGQLSNDWLEIVIR